ncbi:MAG: MFS transporter [Promethearchaeota archaeon CR_4]|nr:MAG: MFS transporter [Candidatus Lokiarchaeota archaeon CR_4]
MVTLLLIIIYLAFISLGLPDGLLGSAWPVMQPEFGIPYGFAGLVSMIISGGTILSSIFSSRILKRFGTGLVMVVSVAITAVALFGFALTPSFLWLVLIAVPLGLGGGAVDAALNAYVAEHYESRHMSWLHCFWGVGALAGPLLLSVILTRGGNWRSSYLLIATIQLVLVVVLIFSAPLWTKVSRRSTEKIAPIITEYQSLFFPLKIRGVKIALLVFFCYCGIESTMGLWGGSYLFKIKGLTPASAATWISLFYASITLGRFLTGFITYKVSNNDLIRAGSLAILAGVGLILFPLPLPFTLAGFLLLGLGCAPIYPCMLHETPDRFGAANAHVVMGFQMAVAYIGTTFLPPLFGFIISATSLTLLPFFLLCCIILLMLGEEVLRKKFNH